MNHLPIPPRYGHGSLADVVPSLLSGLGVPAMANTLALPSARRVCLLLVDGLGWHLLMAHAPDAPFLASLAAPAEPITAVFPSTTAASIASVGTGAAPGEHGIVGYTFATPDDELVNALSWGLHGTGQRVDLRQRFVPEQAQPAPTAFERAADAGVTVRVAVAHQHRRSGLTRAVLRGGQFQGVHALGDLASTALDALASGDQVFCYAYHADLDLLGHIHGPGSPSWRFQLGHVDRLAASIAAGLPAGSMLVVTADHGMVRVPEDQRVDFDTEPHLQHGVRLLGGEGRARHVYTEPGATADVFDAWRELLGERVWIKTRDEACEAGWFGPRVSDRARARIGDLVVAARTDTAIVRSAVEPTVSRFHGHHGSLTADEQLVPLLTFQTTG